MTKSHKNVHVGGQQMPLLTPDSSWKRISELPDLRQVPIMALDRETRDDGLANERGPGWAYGAGHTIGLACAWDGGSFYAPTRHPDSDCFDPDQVRQWELDHAHVRKVYHNANYDLGWGVVEGVPLPQGEVEDTMAMEVLCDENRRTYGLDDVCARHGLPGKDESAMNEAAAAYGYHGKKAVKANMWRLPARYVGGYAEQDAVATLNLFHKLKPELERQGLEDAYRLEMDIVPMVVEMRRRGVRVDVEAAESAKALLEERRDATFRELSERLGTQVGMEEIGKNAWLTRMHDQHGINYPRTAKGAPSFTAGSTGWMHKHPHWLPQMIVKADKLHNAATKFLQGFIIDYAHKSRIHPGINQLLGEDDNGVIRGTRTFRFSYSDPALQQMPARDEELAALIRGVFLPEEGEWWLSADYSQQEYRLIVHFAQLLGCTKADVAAARYRDDPDTDYHSMVADLTGLERKPAKDTNFAKSYGAGIPKFADMINKTVEEAAEIMNQYDREMPFVKELSETCQKMGAKRGYIRLLDGARSHFDDWELAWREKDEPFLPPARIDKARAQWPGRRLRRADTKDAMNRLIQGSAARQTKMAMRACWRAGYVPLLQMHDELDFSINRGEDGARVLEMMRDIVQLEVPMKVDGEYGPTWGRAKKSWDEREAA